MKKSLTQYLKDIGKLKVPEVRKVARKIVKENQERDSLLIFSEKLLNSRERNKLRLGINLLLLLPTTPYELMKKHITDFADSEDWELREEAAQVIRSLLVGNFDRWFTVLKEFIESQSDNLKRAAIVGSMATGIKSEHQIRKIAEKIYQPVLDNKENYIRVNLGPFAFGAFFLRLFPEVAFEYFDKWIKRKDEWVRWNIIMAFSGARGKEYPEAARKYIKIVEDDKNPTIQRAIISVLRKLPR